MYQKDLNNLLDEYMLTGGIPKIVSRYAQGSTLADPDYETYLHALTGEWSRIHRNTSLLNQLGRRLVLGMGESHLVEQTCQDGRLERTGHSCRLCRHA